MYVNEKIGLHNPRLKEPVHSIFELNLSVSMWDNQNLKIESFMKSILK